MLTLQSTFVYDDADTSLVTNANIIIHLPQLEPVDNTDAKTIALVTTGQAEITFSQLLSNKTYHVDLPTSTVFGPNYGTAIVSYLRSLFIEHATPGTADLTISFSVSYGGDASKESSYEALFFFKAERLIPRADTAIPAPDASPRLRATIAPGVLNGTRLAGGLLDRINAPLLNPTPSSVSGDSPLVSVPVRSEVDRSTRVNGIVDANLYCINKVTYMSYLKQWFPAAQGSGQSVLLYVINALVDISGPSPALIQSPSAAGLELFNQVLRVFNLGPNDAAFETITKNFSDFFDFPLKMPTLQLLSLGGNLHINTPPPQKVSMRDFAFYHLSASFSIKDGAHDDEPMQHISRYDWDSTSFLGDNALKFGFTDKYTTDSISGPVTVSVTGFDNTELFTSDFNATAPALQNLNIVVNLQTPPVMTGGSIPGGGSQNSNKKIKGKVVSLSKTCTLKGTVVIQAKLKPEDKWQIVSTGNSDQAGNFAMPYPYGKYNTAQALTSLDPNSLTAVKVNSESTTESISDDFLYVLLQTPSDDKQKKEDCGCNATTTAGRLPSQDDLIQSDQYTQDIGGTCINLTIPNRTLREFNYTALVRNSDPDVANYSLSSTEIKDSVTGVRNVTYQLTSQGKVTRRRIDLDNPIKWEDVSCSANETLYEAVSVSTGHVLHYKSEFRADGYSLGNLLYALPLAPGQKKNIVILDSSHSFRGTEDQSLSLQEQLRNDLLSERDIVDDIGGNIGERMSGSSEATTAGVSASAGASGGGVGYSANVGVAGGFAKSSSEANQNSGRDLAGHFSEILKQGVHQNAASYRQQNTSIVTTAQEAQHYQAETTVIANHNHCHSITIMHYEVLRHFAIFQELVDVEECVFIPFPLTKFAMDNICKWADVLVTRLLPLHSNTYLDPGRFFGSSTRHPLVPAFDPLERVRTDWALVDWPTGRYDEEMIIWLQGEFSIRTDIPRPKTRYDMIKSFSIIPRQNRDEGGGWFLGIITGGLSLLASGSSGSETQVRKDISDKFIKLDADYQNKRPADAMRLYNLSKVTAQNSIGFDPVEFFANSPREKEQWIAYATLLGKESSLEGVRELLSLYFLEATISEWDGIWLDNVAPVIYKAMFDSVAFTGINGQDFTQLSKYRGSQSTMRVSFRGSAGKARKDTNFITLVCNRPAVKELAKYDVEFTLTTLRVTYATQHYNGLLYNGGVNNDLLDGVTVFCPESAAEQRNPRTDDRWLAQKLKTHLNRNLEYYNRVLLYYLDAQRRFMLLDGFHMEVYLPDGKSAGYHSLSSVLKNQPVGMAGNSMVFPVSPGYKVDQSFIIKSDDGDETSNTLLDFYRPEIPTAPYRMSVPSKGIYSESMMGACDSCEKVKPNSSQDWTRFNTDEPTAINPVTTPTPEVTTYNPTTKDFATPMISIQNAPNAPAPGVGLAGVTEVLSKAGVFKDITGLDANQQNALKTYLANTEAASAASGRTVAGMATSMATQAHNTTNSPSIMGTIQQAQDSGVLTQAEAGQLVKQHIQSQIDGGATQKAQLEQNKEAAKPSLSGAAVAAIQRNKNVDATVVDGEGNVSSVKVTGANTATVTEAKVDPAVPAIAQKTDNVCWAAAATMLASWKLGKTLTPEDALAQAGQNYVDQYSNNITLKQGQKDDFIERMGMVSEPPASYPPSQFVTWMKTFGPLWVTTDSSSGPDFSPHAKILIQVDGDGNEDGSNTTFTWINPAKIASGPIIQSFKDFLLGYEQMVTDNPGGLYTQIVHFADKIGDKLSSTDGSPDDDNDKGEGFELGGPWDLDRFSPVHENLVLAALMASNPNPLNKSTTVDGAPVDVHEILRGAYWNDDPACLLFDDKENDNWDFSSGLAYKGEFQYGEDGKAYDNTKIIPRVHFWDLQFVHAMGSAVGEDPLDTLAKMMLWLEIMWRVATGDIDAQTAIKDVNVHTQFKTKSYSLGDFFTSTSVPKISDNLFQLLTVGTKFTKVNIPRRALGSCFHVLQDSYAKGHTSAPSSIRTTSSTQTSPPPSKPAPTSS